MSRITVASLDARTATLEATLAQIVTTQASQTDVLTGLTKALTTLTAQFATPAPVASLAAHKANRKAGKTAPVKVTPKKATLTPAQEAEKAAKQEAATQAYKARKAALSPLNKALFAQGLTGDAWAGRYTNTEAMTAALATLTAAQRKAALEVLAA